MTGWESFLCEHFCTQMPIEQIAAAMGCSVPAAYYRGHKLGLKRPPPAHQFQKGVDRLWTPETVAVLRADFPRKQTAEVAARLGMTERQIYSKAYALGLHKSPDYDFTARIKRGQQRGSGTQFKPGHKTWNKGRKFSAGGRSVETQFKPGARPHTAVPVGTVVAATKGYYKVKVAEPRTWRWLHRMLWEQAHGPVPVGHVVAFKDGNWQNCVIENLELITRQELQYRNHPVRMYSPEVFSAIQLLGQLNRKINEREQGVEREHEARPDGATPAPICNAG